jgi:hypothetical protein
MLTSSQVQCKECGAQLDPVQQPNVSSGYISLITCWDHSCALYGVTLSTEYYAKLTEAQIEAYGVMNRVSRPKYEGNDPHESDIPHAC